MRVKRATDQLVIGRPRRYLRPGRHLSVGIIFAVSIMLLLAGCGGSRGSSSNQIKATIHAFLVKQAEGKGEEACSFLTGKAKTQLVKVVAAKRHVRLPETTSCPAAVALAHALAGKDLLDAIRAAQVSDVQVRGDAASARVTDDGHFPPETVRLQEKVEHHRPREWLIAGAKRAPIRLKP